MRQETSVERLVELGLTRLESSIYVFLLGESPATGYRVARGIEKPTANTYKAIESLESKGLLMVEDDEKRLYRAIPYEEMLGELERRFVRRRNAAAEALARITPPGDDDRVYRLRSTEHILERCRSMLERARTRVLVDAFPNPLDGVRNDLEAAAARGVEVTAKVYRDTSIPGVRVVADYRGESVLAGWSGQWLNLVVDAAEHLLAYLSPDGTSVLQAVWSGSPYLSWIYHCGIASEIALDEVAGAVSDGKSITGVRAVLDRYRPGDERDLAGRKALERLGDLT